LPSLYIIERFYRKFQYFLDNILSNFRLFQTSFDKKYIDITPNNENVAFYATAGAEITLKNFGKYIRR
jgi:hypothetical protein